MIKRQSPAKFSNAVTFLSEYHSDGVLTLREKKKMISHLSKASVLGMACKSFLTSPKQVFVDWLVSPL